MENLSQPKEDKLVSLVGYFGPIGWIIAYVMYSSQPKTELNSFHLRQSLGANIFAVAGSIIASVITIFLAIVYFGVVGNIISYAVYVVSLIFFIMGIINAANGEKKYLPILGEKFEEMFKGVVK